MSKVSKSAIIILTAFAAGICNGFLGAGGGIIIVSVLLTMFADCFEDKRDIYANAQAVMLPVSAVSFLIYCIMGTVNIENIGAFVLPAVAGGVIGGLMLSRFKSRTVTKIFAIIVIVSGFRMIM